MFCFMELDITEILNSANSLLGYGVGNGSYHLWDHNVSLANPSEN